MLVEDTGFVKCFSTSGSSIYYESLGQFSQQCVCSYQCNASSKDGICCKIVSPEKIHVFDSSISKSGDESYSGARNLYCLGSVNVSSINISYAKTIGRCIFEFNQISEESRIIYSTFCNNSQNSNPTFVSFMNGTSGTRFLMQFCNYLDNKGHSSTSLVANDGLTTVITNCSFQRNSPHYTRFRKDSGSMTIQYCYITDNIQDYGDPTVTNTLTSLYQVTISHFSSYSCEAKFPLKYAIIHNYEKQETFDNRFSINKFLALQKFVSK